MDEIRRTAVYNPEFPGICRPGCCNKDGQLEEGKGKGNIGSKTGAPDINACSALLAE